MNYAGALEHTRGAPEEWTNICLAPGTYAGPVRLADAQFVRILAPEGGVKIQASVMPSEPVDGKHSTLEIARSRNIVVSGLEIHNTYTFDVGNLTITSGYSGVSRALALIDTEDVLLDDVRLTSNGKQTVHIKSAKRLSFRNAHIAGYYFLVDLNWSSPVVFSKVKFEQDAGTVLPKDEHSMLWTYQSDAVLEDSVFRQITGRSLLSGIQSTDNRIVVAGRTMGNLDSWVQAHPNYRNILIHITGSYPSSGAYWRNPFNGGGPSEGSAVCTVSTGALQCQGSP